MENFAAASRLVIAHRPDAVGKAILQILEGRMLSDTRAEGIGMAVLRAVMEIQTLRPLQKLH